MFKPTPCYNCTRPERQPHCLCRKDCKVYADYEAEKAEYDKQRQVEYGLNLYVCKITARCKKYSQNYGGNK